MLSVLDLKLLFQVLSLLLCFFMILYFLLKAKKTSLFYSYIIFQGLIGIWLIGQRKESIMQLHYTR